FEDTTHDLGASWSRILARGGGIVLLWFVACARTVEPPHPPAEITAMAAASLTDALPKVAEGWTSSSGTEVKFTFGGSSTLAQQLEGGGTADLLFTADREWMDWSADRSLVRKDTVRKLLGNELVAVVPAEATFVPASAAELADPKVARLGIA